MNTDKIERSGKIFMLAYDQGLEHGPTDFNDKNYKPEFIVDLARKSGASCVAMQYGIARQVYTPELAAEIPLVLKVNGKTKLNSQNYLGALTATVEDALRLGAVGIGFTINPGQKDDHIGYEQFSKIRSEAEKHGLVTVLWSYARGPEIADQFDPKVVAYATRIAAELGADVAKVKYTGDPETFAWAVKSAGKTKVVASGTDNFDGDYISKVADMMTSGAAGIAVGRKVWQDADAENMGKLLAEKIYNATPKYV